MKNFSTWLLACFVVMFWVFRIIVALMAQMGQDFVVQPFNETMEIILLFVVLVCVVLIVKRKLTGALIYLLAYGIYFGVDVANNIQTIVEAIEGADVGIYINLFMSIVGIILPIAVLLDLIADKNRKNHPKDKKTDWFYTNEQFDRQLDERADKNNYRTL